MDKEYITLDELKEIYSNVDKTEKSLEEMKKIESMIINEPAKLIFDLILHNELIKQATELHEINKSVVVLPEIKRFLAAKNVNDYYKGLKDIKPIIMNFLCVAIVSNENEIFEETINDDLLNDFAHSYMNIYDNVLEYYKTCTKIEALNNQELSKEEYFRLSSKFNKKIVGIFDECSKMLVGPIENDSLLGSKDTCDKICDVYALMAIKFELCFDPYKKEKSEVKTNYTFQISNTEKERINQIQKANDMYNQLYLDWIRDLDKQTPQSTRDKASLIKEKFNKMRERFNMPLAPSTSLGMAKEACSQINNLMASITDLSHESYNISSYEK